jgi:multidrug resistance efflux pump
MRLTRLIIGFLVIVVAIGIIASEQLAGASADAVVNARLTTVRAPIAGTLTSQRRALGTSVTSGESLGTLQDPLVDGVRLDDLVREQQGIAAEILNLEQSIAAVEKALGSLAARTRIYREERLRQLEAAVRSSAALKALAEERAKTRSAIGSARARSATQRSADLELEDAQQRAIIADIALEAARKGVYVGDGYNDAPYSDQQTVELSLRLSILKAELASARARSDALSQRVDAERVRLSRLASAELVSNVRGRVWEVIAGSGETVQRGQDIMKLVDCDSTIVTLSVSESVYNGLKAGDSAVFRAGDDGRTFAGTVTRLAGSGAATVYRNLAIAPSARHLERYDVSLLSPALNEDSGLGCAVGRTGRVFFEARPLDFLRNLWD